MPWPPHPAHVTAKLYDLPPRLNGARQRRTSEACAHLECCQPPLAACSAQTTAPLADTQQIDVTVNAFPCKTLTSIQCSLPA